MFRQKTGGGITVEFDMVYSSPVQELQIMNCIDDLVTLLQSSTPANVLPEARLDKYVTVMDIRMELEEPVNTCQNLTAQYCKSSSFNTFKSSCL